MIAAARRGDGARYMKYLSAKAWPTLDEVQDCIGDDVTAPQARAGFGYYGLGIYHHTPNPPGGPVVHTNLPPPSAFNRSGNPVSEPRAVPPPAAPRDRNGAILWRWTDVTPAPIFGPVVAVAFIRQDLFPAHIVVQGWRNEPWGGWRSIACLYTDVASMFADYYAQGCKWFGRPDSGPDAVVLGVWGRKP